MIKTILIVDDSPVARKMLKSSLPKDKGYQIIEAKDGQDGIDKYQEHAPEVVFMDLTMPVLDGYKTIPEIRKINKNAIIIVTTADIQPKSIASVMDLGAFTVLKKPVKSQSVEDVLIKAQNKLEKSGDQ